MTLIINDEHTEILNATNHVLVTGGPGSGKTTIALQKAVKYIEEEKLKPGQKVLFLSFSRAAVSRISESADLVVTNKDFHKLLSIQTFHSFFWEIIKTHAYLLGAPHKLRVLPPHDEDSLRQKRANDDTSWLLEKEEQFFNEGKVCFDLFAPTALRLLVESASIRNLVSQKFPLIVVDEAQDTDSSQWECIKALVPHCQIIALADLDQQIHDYREDVAPERIADIIRDLSPIQVALGSANHRSAGTEITTFARDLLNNTPREGSYDGVSLLSYSPRSQRRDQRIRQSIGILNDRLRRELGRDPENIAILATWGRGVKIISNALRESSDRTEIPHRVQFDETATYLSSRVIAFLLEPRMSQDIPHSTMEVLELMRDLCRAKGQQAEWEKYERWCSEIRGGAIPTRGTIIPEIQRIIGVLNSSEFIGDPEKDWLMVKELLLSSTVGAIIRLGKNAEYLMAFNRGRLISKGLGRQWEETGSYKDARLILNAAIIETQMVSENRNNKGINVMTVHKAKGKEFDGVILFDDFHSSPFIARGDEGSFMKSRRLLLVGITRARYHTIILVDASRNCPIIGNFHL